MKERPPLTQRLIETAKPNGREQFFWDHKITGLAYRLRASGARSFVYQYRTVYGRVGRFKVGDPAVITLEQARKKARELAYQVDRDGDPSALKALARKSTVESAWKLYEENRVSQLSPAHQIRTRGIFQAHILQEIGQKPITAVARGDIRGLTDKILKAGKPAMANNVHRASSAFLSWCAERDLLEANPLYGIRQPTRSKSRERVLRDRELKSVWDACHDLNAQWSAAIRLLMLTGMRRAEVLGAETREIDIGRKVWVIPEERSKNRHVHVVHLTDQAVEIIRSVPHYGARTYLFQSELAKGFQARPIVETTASIRKLKKLVPIPHWCLHDLRRSVATHMGRLGIQTHVIEVVLNHRSGFRSGVGGIYNRYNYSAEAKSAWELWAKTLQEWVSKDYPPERVLDEDHAVVI